MSSQLFEKVRSITADILEVSPGQLTPQSSSENIETWDSVHHLNLILAFEQEFGIQLEPEEIDQMNNVERITRILARKLNHQG
jgi:acyl carrier protein